MRMNHMILAILLALSSTAVAQPNKLAGQTGAVVQKKFVKEIPYPNYRDLDDYGAILGPSFASDLEALSNQDVWLDSGAGEARALVDYLGRRGTAKLVAVDYRCPTTGITSQAMKRHAEQFKFVCGDFVEKHPVSRFYPVSLITDLSGAMMYATHVDEVLRALLGFLKSGGVLHTQPGLQDGFESYFETKIYRLGVNGAWVRVPFVQWLEAVQGVAISRTVSPAHDVSFRIKKISENVVVPPLKLLFYNGEGTAIRRYLWE
jgi:hypothetical protein